jgi:hypothetical protein
MSAANRERFAEVYAVKLTEAVTRNPGDYFYPVSGVPAVVAKMVPSLAEGKANVGPAIQATARALGIKPTATAIREYLTAGAPAVDAEGVCAACEAMTTGPDGRSAFCAAHRGTS